MPRPKKEKPNRTDGIYEVKITLEKTLDGKYVRKSFYSSISKENAKRQAEQYKVDYLVAKQGGTPMITKNAKFKDWAETWLEVYKKPEVSENSYKDTYKNSVQNHLIPYFGQALIADIMPLDIKNFFSTKSDYSESMLDKMRLCLNGIFEAAIDNDLCIKNPVKNITYSSNTTTQKKQVYTTEEINVVKKFAADKMPEVIFLLETGLRRGELVGLKWIDITDDILNVERSLAFVKGGGIVERPPKWHSYRKIPLSPDALSIISKQPRISEYIFLNSKGRPNDPRYWSKRLERFMMFMNKEKGIKILSAHELRHTYGTNLRRNGVDIYTIQKLMGHKDIKMTSEIYVENEIEVLKKNLGHMTDKEKPKKKRYKCRSNVVVRK